VPPIQPSSAAIADVEAVSVAPTQPEGDTSSIGASVPWVESSMLGLRVALVDMRGRRRGHHARHDKVEEEADKGATWGWAGEPPRVVVTPPASVPGRSDRLCKRSDRQSLFPG
jgi:hypothetical protein